MRRTVRHEWKFQISPATAVLLSTRLNIFLKRDAHAGPEGYRIRSLYFDDVNESAFYDKLAGVNERVKYRLRYYNDNAGVIFFERKRKHDVYIEKDSFRISREMAEHMIRDMALPVDMLCNPLMEEFAALRSTRLMRPRVIVDYHRLAYVYPEQNVRITLDSGVRSGLYKTGGFFGSGVSLPVAENDFVILEVKYDAYLPNWPKEAISPLCLMPQASSKFCSSVLPMI